MMNQYHATSNLTLIIRLFFIILIAVGLISPFTFLKERVVQTSKTKAITDNTQTISINTVVETVNKTQKIANVNVKRFTTKRIDEKPLHDVELPKFYDIRDVKEKKRQFFAFIRPAIEHHHDQILKQRSQLISIREEYLTNNHLSTADQVLIANLIIKYKVNNKYNVQSKLNRLLNKIDIVPIPLTLVQAANESAWGTSRFSRVGLNFFGIWCFKKGCGMVPNGRDFDADHEVEAFQSVEDAIRRYTFNINTNRAYRVFRKIRKQYRDDNLPLSSEALAEGLIHYSERGDEYVNELIEMIRHNQHYFSYTL